MAHSNGEISPASFTSFGPLLRFLRRRAHLTQRELSIEVGYNFAQISRLEADQRSPDPTVVAATFVPALGLESEPAWSERLIELAGAARNQSEHQLPTQAIKDPSPEVDVQRDAPTETVIPAVPLLVTKLYVPRARPGLVSRPRLLKLLNQGLDTALTIVSAPAGFGKSTLIADWLAQIPEDANAHSRPHQVAWLALDDSDNDPTTFLRYLIAALQTVAPMVGNTAIALAQAPQPTTLTMVMRLLLNDLATLPHETVLVLDDYHLITSQDIHVALTEMFEHLPPTMHVVIATRTDPPFPLARWRARDHVVELRATVLRFSLDESETFLTDVMGIPLSTADTAALATRTEGWIAGLQLAALAMRDRRDLTSFINAFTGSNRFVVDYLATEVFERQPAHMQTFLLQTSILDRLCGPLCDAVLGIGVQGSGISTSSLNPEPQPLNLDSYSQLMLDQLEQANLFLIPLDDERHWYRYHHLFGEVLRERLTRGAKMPDIRRLHSRASTWYESQGLVEEAVQHVLEAADWQSAERVLEAYGMLMMMSGRMQRIRSWLEMLPREVMQENPFLAYTYVGSLMVIGEYEVANKATQVVERAISTVTDDNMVRLLQGAVAVARSGIFHFLGDAVCSFDLAQLASELLPERSSDAAGTTILMIARPAVPLFLSNAYKVTGDVTATNEQLSVDAIRLTQEVGNWITMLTGYANLVHLQMWQGRLRRAVETYDDALKSLPRHYELEAFPAGVPYFLIRGYIYSEWNDLDAAERELAKGIELGIVLRALEADLLLLGFWAMARVQYARGKVVKAFQLLDQFIQIAHERKYAALLVDRARAAQVRLLLLQNNLTKAAQWADTSQLRPSDTVEFPQEFLYLTFARVYIAQGQAREIMPMLDALLVDAETKARIHSAIEILELQALAWQALGDQQQAIAVIERALRLAEPEGYVRVFIDEGAPMRLLLQAMFERGIMLDYTAHLIAAYS